MLVCFSATQWLAASTFHCIIGFPCSVTANMSPLAFGAQFTLNRVQDAILKDQQRTPEKEYPAFMEGNTFYWPLFPLFIVNRNQFISAVFLCKFMLHVSRHTICLQFHMSGPGLWESQIVVMRGLNAERRNCLVIAEWRSCAGGRRVRVCVFKHLLWS